MVLPKKNPTKSYWIEAAESPLRDFRSTPDLPETTDVAIIGSGYAGTTTAYWIDKYTEKSPEKPRVTILEARDICGSATGRNGGQLRPHIYSRYPKWSDRFGADGAMELIEHEMAHLTAFKDLAAQEGIAEEICLKFGETFDAAMTDEAWKRLKGAYEDMKRDHGADHKFVKACRIIENPQEAEEFTQMKGALAAIVHPTGQVWPYKFIHALLRILLEKGNLNLQAHTPVIDVSERGSDGWISVKTERGTIRAKTVVHATNRWAPHLLPEFSNLIVPDRGVVAAIKAPQGFMKHTGAQHFDSVVNNYYLQLPPPYNSIIMGGARQFLVHTSTATFMNDDEDQHVNGVANFFKTWPAADVASWPGADTAELGKDDEQGGCWTGSQGASVDSFPFVGPLPSHDGHFIAAGFSGHGMPRILLTTAHIAPQVLDAIGVAHSEPALASQFPPLPKPFYVSSERIANLQSTDPDSLLKGYMMRCDDSARKPFCHIERVTSALSHTKA